MSDLHTQLGALAIGLNVLAALIGAVAWLVRRNPKPFWWCLRAGQVLIMVEAVIGAALLLDGRDLPRLHLIYGLTPIAVAFDCRRFLGPSHELTLTKMNPSPAPSTRKTIAGR